VDAQQDLEAIRRYTWTWGRSNSRSNLQGGEGKPRELLAEFPASRGWPGWMWVKGVQFSRNGITALLPVGKERYGYSAVPATQRMVPTEHPAGAFEMLCLGKRRFRSR